MIEIEEDAPEQSLDDNVAEDNSTNVADVNEVIKSISFVSEMVAKRYVRLSDINELPADVRGKVLGKLACSPEWKFCNNMYIAELEGKQTCLPLPTIVRPSKSLLPKLAKPKKIKYLSPTQYAWCIHHYLINNKRDIKTTKAYLNIHNEGTSNKFIVSSIMLQHGDETVENMTDELFILNSADMMTGPMM